MLGELDRTTLGPKERERERRRRREKKGSMHASLALIARTSLHQRPQSTVVQRTVYVKCTLLALLERKILASRLASCMGGAPFVCNRKPGKHLE